MGTRGPGTSDPLRQGIDRWFGYNCQAVAHNFYPTYLWIMIRPSTWTILPSLPMTPFVRTKILRTHLAMSDSSTSIPRT